MLLVCLFIMAGISSSWAQQNPAPRTEEYCDVEILNHLWKGITIAIDYGQEPKVMPESLKGEDGKPMVFNSPIHALNFMSSLGWELVEVYMEKEGSRAYKHFLMKREVVK